MKVIHTKNGYQDEFRVQRENGYVAVLTDPHNQPSTFNILYLNRGYNSHGALHLLLNTPQDAEALRDALAKAIEFAASPAPQEVQPSPAAQPPFGSKRAAALALYKPPFRFQHGYIFDAGGHMVADQGGFAADDKTVEGSVAARIRGWGRIGYMPDPEALQDEVGTVVAEALTAFWQAALSAAPAPAVTQTAQDGDARRDLCYVLECIKCSDEYRAGNPAFEQAEAMLTKMLAALPPPPLGETMEKKE